MEMENESDSNIGQWDCGRPWHNLADGRRLVCVGPSGRISKSNLCQWVSEWKHSDWLFPIQITSQQFCVLPMDDWAHEVLPHVELERKEKMQTTSTCWSGYLLQRCRIYMLVDCQLVFKGNFVVGLVCLGLLKLLLQSHTFSSSYIKAGDRALTYT